MAQSKEGLSAEAGQYVMPSRFVESDSVEVQDFVSSALRDLPADAIDRDKAIRLFEAVRDGIRYDPYCFALDEDSYRASRIAGAEAAFCVPKAILLAACLRAAGIPAALAGFDNVVLTPHLAGSTRETWRDAFDLMCANLAAFLAGEPLPTPVR